MSHLDVMLPIRNILDNLGKFDGKSDEGFFVGYSLSSKAFRVYNTRTGRVEENFHIGFLENKPMVEGNGPKWLFDIDSLTQSMSYVLVAAGTITNESIATQGELYEDGLDNESDEKDKSDDDSSLKEVNTAGQHINTASPEVNTGSFKLNIVDPSISTASSKDQDSPKGMFKLGATHTLETTHVEFFSDKDEPEVDLGNITNSYTVPTTPNTRIHNDHPIKNVIGDVKLSVQTRRMTKPTSEQGKNFCNSNSNRFGYLWIYILERGPLEQNDSSETRKMKEGLSSGIKQGFKDPDNRDKVYKVVKALYGLHQAPRAWITSTTEGRWNIISQDKYVAEILKKFIYTDVKSASTSVDLEKPLVKDRDADDAYEHLYRSMIGSLMYLTTSRPDIMFAVCACARFEVNPKTSHLLAVKRIFRYFKGKPTLGLSYSKDSPFELVAYTHTDYAGATQDRKSTTRGPYTPTIFTTPAVPATEDSPAVPEQTIVETIMNMTPKNRAHFESKKEVIHLILTGIGDEIYSTVDACQTAQEM
ncbi:uncharacterized mitochondrial protein-like protein [Tanacetum coccineum]